MKIKEGAARLYACRGTASVSVVLKKMECRLRRRKEEGMKKRVLSLLLAGMLTAGMLAGCEGGGENVGEPCCR